MYTFPDGATSETRPASFGEFHFPPDITDEALGQFGISYTPDLLPEIPVPTLSERQAMAWAKIMAHRDRLKLKGGYQVAGKWYHSDTFSRTQQIGLVVLGANIPAGLLWKTMDGSFVAMTQTLAQQVFGAAAQSDTTIFTVAETHRQHMLAAADPDLYDFSGGWPTTFLG